MRPLAITCLALGIAACRSDQSRARKADEAAGLEGFVHLPAATGLELGTNEPEGSRFYHASEARISVDVPEFWISRSLVTAAEYCEFLNSDYARSLAPVVLCVTDEQSWYRWANIEHVDGVWKPRRASARAPAWTATWRGAVEYSEWRSRNDAHGVRYRLPTEAEWEYAARGKAGRTWPWGNEPPTPDRGHRWQRHPWNDEEPWLQLQCDVGSFLAGATPEGVLDLMAWREWCVNVFRSKPLASDLTATTVVLPEDCVLRVGEWRWNLGHSGAPRAVRGPDRMDIEKPCAGIHAWRIVVALLTETDTTPSHAGRVWSRVAADPADPCAFRLVADLPK